MKAILTKIRFSVFSALALWVGTATEHHLKQCVLILVLFNILPASFRLHASPGYAEGELLVKWRDGPESYAAAVGTAQIGSTVKRNFNALGWQLVKLPEGMSVREGMEAYKGLGTISAVEPNGRIEPILPPATITSDPARGLQRASLDHVSAGATIAEGSTSLETAVKRTEVRAPPPPGLIPNDPLFSQQWYLNKIGAPQAWGLTTGSTNIVVAIIGTGVDYTHPDLAPNMWRNPGETGLDANGNDKATNGIDDDGNGYVDDVHGIDLRDDDSDPMDIGIWESPVVSNPRFHGTFVAGIVGAAGNDGLGIAGVNWSVRLMAIRAFGGDLADPSLIAGVFSDILAGLDYVLTMKRRGVNIRVTNFTGVGYVESAAISDAIATSGSEGVLLVCPAADGPVNQDVFVTFPAGYNQPSVISVAASTETDELADFSNYGKSTVDLAAPGVNFISTWEGTDYYSG